MRQTCTALAVLLALAAAARAEPFGEAATSLETSLGELAAEVEALRGDVEALEAARPCVCGPEPPAEEAWDRVIEDLVLTGDGLTLSGHAWDNTLIRNVTILDALENGIFLKNVANVRIEDSVILGAGRNGIHLSSAGASEGVAVVGNLIRDTGQNGVHAARREAEGVHHPGLRILGNTIDNTGLDATHGLHGIYVQSSDALIEGNRVLRTNAGNGISVRSSGVVRGNLVVGVVREESDGGAGIAYYSDHAAGPSGVLVIEGNVIDGSSITGPNGTSIRLLGPARSEPLGPAGRVRRFVIRDNQNLSETAGDLGIEIHPEWTGAAYELQVSGNRQVAR